MPVIQEPGEVALEPSTRAIELSFPLPKAPETKIHLQLTINATSLLLFLTTVYGGDAPTAAPLGSFVYALPDVSLIFDSILFTAAHCCRGTTLVRPFLHLFTHMSLPSSSQPVWHDY